MSIPATEANGKADVFSHEQRKADGAACLTAALDYHGRGWSAIALCPPDHVGVRKAHGKTCNSPGKAPWGLWKDYQSRLATEGELRKKWKDNPTLNVGMVYGQVSGLVGIDIDSDLADDALTEISAGDLPPTLEFLTGGGGRRLLYRVPAGVLLKTTARQLDGEHAELRFQAEGAQTVMPPSRHEKSGKLYEWVPGHGPDEIEAAPAPKWLIDKLRDETHKSNGKAAPAGERIVEGGRNSALLSLAGTMRRRGMSAEAIEAALLAENESKCEPPLDDSEVRGIAQSIRRYEPSAPANNDEVNEAADDPHRLARLFLDDFRHGEHLTLRYHQDEWLRWTGAAYEPRATKDLLARLAEKVKAEFDRINQAAIRLWEENQGADKNGKPCPKPVARKVTTRLLADTRQALAGMTLLPATVEPPTWLKGAHPDHAAIDPIDLLVCRNGIGALPALAMDGGPLIPHTPTLFTKNALTYDYNETAPPPACWTKFLEQLWPDKLEDCITTLQDWFGYVLTPDTRQQKILMIVGPKRSGKGTIARVLRQLVGTANCCSPTLAGLGTNFGLWPLLGKSVAFISDARLSGRTDQAIVAERLLSISGEDAQTIDRKNMSHVTVKLPTRFVILTNELPRLNDASGALAGRMIVLPLTRSFYGHEDHGLTDRLLAELPCILNWAIEGWLRLRNRGRFLQPKAGEQLVEALEDLASPVGEFLREECQLDPAYEIFVRDLYDAWKSWCANKGRKDTGTEQVFGRDLRAAVPSLHIAQRREGDDRLRFYRGLRLRR